MIWLKFAAIQLVMLLATVIGWFLLVPFCLAQAWERVGISSKDRRPIDRWRAYWLDVLFGNIEDGVSGQTALVWNKAGTEQIPYAPTQFVWLNAYLWSAWRNSCDNLKYVFADPKGPLVTFKVLGRTVKIGWQLENGTKVPVMSI